MRKIVVPPLGEGIEKAMIAFWFFKVGERVEKDADLVELVTDKAAFNITADQAGVLKEIYVPEGQEAAIGQEIAVIE